LVQLSSVSKALASGVVEQMEARGRIVVAALLAAGAFAPTARTDVTVPAPPLPQPIQGLLSPPDGSGAQSAPASDAKTTVAAVPAFARSVVAQINRTRARYHLRALRRSSILASAGTAHVTALATSGLFAHSWPDGRPFATWIRTFYSDRGYRAWSVGENLLWSTPGIDPQTVVERWLASPTHRHILLMPSWREVGLGVVSASAAPGAYGGYDVDIVAAEFGTRTK
jgi:uncharacterized protein YkwD